MANDISVKKRIEWIDLVKGYGMLFVIMQHLNFTPSIYRTVYAPFFLTAFFVTAGYVFSSQKRFDKFLLRKVQTLLVPLFCLGLMVIGMSELFTYNEQAGFWEQVKDLLVQNGTAGHRLWFIAAMFLGCCIFYPISRLKKQWLIIVCSVLAAANIIFVRYITDIYLPWHLSVMGLICFWMGVGFYLKTFCLPDKLMKFFSSKITLLTAFLAYTILVCVSAFAIGANHVGFSDFDQYPVLYFVLNGGGTLLLICFCHQKHFKLLKKFIVFIGQNTLFYFAFHGKVTSIILALIKKIGMENIMLKYNYVSSVLIALIVALLLILPCIVFNKIFPFAVGKKYNFKKKKIVLPE